MYFFPDYYNYYYGGYSQNPETSDTPETLNAEAAASAAASAAESSDATEVATSKEAAAIELSGLPENCVPATTEVCFNHHHQCNNNYY